MSSETLFEMPPEKRPPLRLYIGAAPYNYRRHCEGKPMKVTVRSTSRKGIVATVYTGMDDAHAIMEAVNDIRDAETEYMIERRVGDSPWMPVSHNSSIFQTAEIARGVIAQILSHPGEEFRVVSRHVTAWKEVKE